MSLNFNQLSSKIDFLQYSRSIEQVIKKTLNCCRIGIVEEFYADTLTAKIQIANKMLVGLNNDGTQIIKDYPPIFAKVCFGNPNITEPLYKGLAGIVLFNDREIESYFINGEVNPLSYERMHDITDALFIPALYSFVNTNNANYVANCLNMFYGNSYIQIADGTITINGNLNITGDLNVTGSITTTGDITAGGVSLINHTHSGVTVGSGNTGKPNV